MVGHADAFETPEARALSETDKQRLIDALGDIPHSTDMSRVKKKSLDFYWYSPVLKPRLAAKRGDILVTPRQEADVTKILSICAELEIPVTARGAGTGNYGQAVPLVGGAVLDMIQMDKVLWTKPGLVRVQAGKLMLKLDREIRATGWEQRMFPSTKRTATIGGFVAGGSGGVGSVTHGVLGDRGNINAARVITCEKAPRILELRGDQANAVNHAYGTTGIITELEMPLAPTWPWRDVVVSFNSFAAAANFGQQLALSDAIVKKLVTPIAWPIPSFFPRLEGQLPDGYDIVICMIAESSMQGFTDLVAAHGGDVVYDVDAQSVEDDPSSVLPLYEYTWNHTTLHAMKVDKSFTYLQSLFPPENSMAVVDHMIRKFGDEVPMHLEMIRSGGQVITCGLQLVRFSTEERLNEIIAYHEANGVAIANPHVWTLEDGSPDKAVSTDQSIFKRHADPMGLLNPGKMRSFLPAAA
ncbi:MAG: FAD-binding oxidoreductase [Alphaproteobacteria bacterium]